MLELFWAQPDVYYRRAAPVYEVLLDFLRWLSADLPILAHFTHIVTLGCGDTLH
jgi:hypothetical protein